ncbi:histidine phosphatase family protein [uncultured Metabacillus sp.]|uniref:histidine phosphatase family protein n=1 Tax=uncultured Metabacillus sp. TaxID=2860135 RepID=UPI0026277DA7|nr:histidine phosphatase family protein [uncultured Metabacillus sp.]
MKIIYLVRHCEANGQEADADLTVRGFNQAIELSNFFSDFTVERIISSPYKRAMKTVQPLAKRLKIEIESNSNLSERILSTSNLPDWYDLYFYSMWDWDAWKDAGGGKQAYSFLPFVFAAYFVTVGCIYSSKLHFFGILFGPVWLPMLSLIPGLVIGFIIMKYLVKKKT